MYQEKTNKLKTFPGIFDGLLFSTILEGFQTQIRRTNENVVTEHKGGNIFHYF